MNDTWGSNDNGEEFEGLLEEEETRTTIMRTKSEILDNYKDANDNSIEKRMFLEVLIDIRDVLGELKYK